MLASYLLLRSLNQLSCDAGDHLQYDTSFQCGNMAREGLRVLVVAKKSLTEEQYQDFEVSLYFYNHVSDAHRVLIIASAFISPLVMS